MSNTRKRARDDVISVLDTNNIDDIDTLFQNLKLNSIHDTISHIQKRIKLDTKLVESDTFITQPIFNFKIRKPYSLYEHQRKVLHWLQQNETHGCNGIRGGIIYLEMGLGKTLIALSLIQSDNSNSANLIICNKTLINTISYEIQKFFGNHLSYVVLHPEFCDTDIHDVDITYFENKQIVLTTYDVIRSIGKKSKILDIHDCTTHKHVLYTYKFKRIVFDESQRLSNIKSKIFKSIQCLNSPIRICLTGTPIKNDSVDLFSQLLLCGLNIDMNWSYKSFEQFNLKQHIFRMTVRESNITLPSKEIIPLYLTFSKDEQIVYDVIREETKKCFTDFKHGRMSFAKVLLCFLKLRQTCVSIHNITSSKFEIVKKIVHEIPSTDKILIFSSFRWALTKLGEELNSQCNSASVSEKSALIHGGMKLKTRQSIIDRFRKSHDLRILLMTTHVGGLGLNLTHANHIVIMEPFWNNSIHDQAIGRLWRIGQLNTVYIWKLIIKETIEQNMILLCREKNNIVKEYFNDINSEFMDRILQ